MKSIFTVYALLWIAGITGWIMNIIKVVHFIQADTTVTGMFIFRCVGILLAPLGAVLGWVS